MQNKRDKNIALIGMPGAGKSTLAKLIADKSRKTFVDTDSLIEAYAGRSLQTIVDTDSYLVLREIEAQIIASLDCENTVIATGGSAVYSDEAMQHLGALALIVFLELPLADICARISNFDTRGLARLPNQSLAELYQERDGLYRNYADITINCAGKTKVQIRDEIIHRCG